MVSGWYGIDNIDNEEGISMQDTISIKLNLDELRLLSKSVSRTRDVELRKLQRLDRDTSLRREVKADYETLHNVDAELQDAIATLAVR